MNLAKFLSVAALLCLVLAACGGSGSSTPQQNTPPPTYSVGGSVSGLLGSNVVLQNNAGDDLAITTNGPFTFATEIPPAGNYDVTVTTQPSGPSQTCSLSNAAGTISNSDVSNINVVCVTNTFNITLSVVGLRGSGLVVQNNGNDDIVIGNDGDYTFSAPVESGKNYNVSVSAEPTDPDQACETTGASGVIGDADVTGIQVSCAALEAIDVFGGGWVSCALLENDRAKCWGHNNFGNLGLGDNLARGTFPGEMGNDLDYVQVGLFVEATQIAPGSHTCAVLSDGDVKCWGQNTEGQLGLGDTEHRGNEPGEMGPSLPRVDLDGQLSVKVGSGSGHSCVLLDDGSVRCWGRSLVGELGQGSTATIGDEPGEMGANLGPVPIGNPGMTAEDIAVGGNHNCVIRDDGSVACWGLNSFGQLGIGNTEVVGNEPNEMGSFLAAVDLGTNRTALQVVAGNSHTCAILDSGFVKCWGANLSGQLGQGDSENRGDDPGELGDNLPIVQLGSVNLQVDQLAAGTNHTCALLENGGVKCWGSNNRGQLGLGDLRDRGDQINEMGFDLPFVDLGTGRTAMRIASGATHSCAALDNGDTKCWGENHFGQLGQESIAISGDGPNEMGDDLSAIDIGSE